MNQIDNLQDKLNLKKYFNQLSGPNYIKILDTPHIWGLPFSKEIMPYSFSRQEEFASAINEVIKKSKYRCDISSLNSPDTDWRKVILQAVDESLTNKIGRTTPTQFRFLFGQSVTIFLNGVTAFINGSHDFVAFKKELIELVKARSQYWEKMPEIWMGRFYMVKDGLINSFLKNFLPPLASKNDTRMTWNHTKIIAADGAEALVGGHNLNMDLFRNYPPVHDTSIVVHGPSAHDAQLFLNEMWACGTNILSKEYLDIKSLSWKNGDSYHDKPIDPLKDKEASIYVTNRQQELIKLHEDFEANNNIKPTDLDKYEKLENYKLANRMLSVGKYWTGPSMENDYKKGSEIMKEQLIKNAKKIIRVSQQDLISAWKKKWSDHPVCHWIMEALLANKELKVQVVVSPLDAAAGAAGDQYSFGSGASRTFELIKYYMTHDADTDKKLDDTDGSRADALKRIQVAPFFFTDQLSDKQTTEGDTYKWPNVSTSAYTATLKQKPLSEKPPQKGIIGSSLMAAIRGSGFFFRKVAPAPGNHSKLMIIDDELYVVGSDNLYPGYLSEFNYVVEGKDAVNELITSYWDHLWQYSAPHAISGI